MLRTYIQTDERERERLPPALELAYNTTSHSSTELSPFEVMIGQNPVTAADLDVVGNLAPTLTPPMTKLFQQLCDGAQSHILRAKWQQKRYADAHRRDVQYNPNDRVWISSSNLPGLNQCPKFEPRFPGPFRVLERIGPDGAPTDTYEVDYILNQRGSRKDIQYLVKWRGAPEDRATWEPAANLTNCCPSSGEATLFQARKGQPARPSGRRLSPRAHYLSRALIAGVFLAKGGRSGAAPSGSRTTQSTRLPKGAGARYNDGKYYGLRSGPRKVYRPRGREDRTEIEGEN
ncbi:uncharacterized protein EMH_0019560 [Eimeria mitis]|uniref:Chromo domain-containing protein n=1 Tax=Eimeria mitis TaxID=44415 RepID=U6KFM3_9EIME|nr:uncharacterized protein EMH_0019560 [Eimeria mitis]CDJ34273.1 hypothetical protein EMH_0019560 [Eimeria mitis]